jgi:hypothetical protein
MILHFGVIELPYVTPALATKAKKPPPPRKRKGAPPPEEMRHSPAPSAVTTADVARWLEDKYHIMEVFYEEHKGMVTAALEAASIGTLEAIHTGAPLDFSIFAEGAGAIEERLRKFITSQEIEEVGIPGVPTMAALEGVSHRFKSRKGNRRPSFVDTGLYVKSLKVWVD